MEALEADTCRPFCPPEFTFDKLYLTTFISHSIMLGRLKKRKEEPSFTFYFRFLNDLIQVALHIISVKIFFFFFDALGKETYYLVFIFEDFWSNLCDMKIYSQDDKSAVLGYGDDQVQTIGNMVGLILIMEFLIAHSSVMIKFRI